MKKYILITAFFLNNCAPLAKKGSGSPVIAGSFDSRGNPPIPKPAPPKNNNPSDEKSSEETKEKDESSVVKTTETKAKGEEFNPSKETEEEGEAPITRSL